MSKQDIEENFNYAVEQIRNLPTNGNNLPSDEIRLKFYGLYKQATIGKCNIPKPWAINIVESKKWESWNSMGNMSQDNAKIKYCELFLKVTGS